MHGEPAMFRNAYALMIATVLTSLLGVGFWAVAARVYDTESVGRASAAIAAMLMVCNASQLNLSVGLMRFLPVSPGRERRVISLSYSVTVAAGFLGGGLFLLVAPRVSAEMSFLRNDGVAALFLVGVMTWVVFSLQDAALTGIRATMWVPVENVVFGLLKLGLLVAFFPVLASHGILSAWVVSMAIMLLPVNWLLFARLLPASSAPAGDARMPAAREMARFVGVDYVGTLLSHASTTALPLLVIAFAGPEVSAVFFVAWTIGSALDFIATGTASSFLVEGAGMQDQAHRYLRAAVKRAAQLLLPVVALVCLMADFVLSIFGAEYRDARWALVVLCLAAVPRMLLLLRLTYLRVQRRVATVVALQALACVSMVGLSTLALNVGGGSLAVALSWLVTELVVLGMAEVRIRRLPTPTSALDRAPAPHPVAAGGVAPTPGRTRG